MSARRRGGPARPPIRYAPREPDAREAVPPAAEPVARQFRALYAAPEDPRYWDGLEARIVAAVRGGAAATGAVTGAVTGAMRAVPAAAVEWWHALARWARPALAAAGVTLAVAGAALLEARASADASRAHSAFRAVLGQPGDAYGLRAPGDSAHPLPEPDPQLARAADAYDADPGDPAAQADARVARVADELLSDGLVRRAPAPHARARDVGRRAHDADRDAQREATFRYVMPDQFQ